MEQRRLRLGDILDDYCPRERRVTNHAVVAMVEEDVKQTRCTTCDAEHLYKGGKPPRRKKAETTGKLYKQVLAGLTDDPALPVSPSAESDSPESIDTGRDLPFETAVAAAVDEDAAGEIVLVSERSDMHRDDADDIVDEPQPSFIEDGPVHRPLIRAQLPRLEGVKVERQAPDFTIRQANGRGNGHFRGQGGNGQGGGGQRFGRGPQRGGGRGGGSQGFGRGAGSSQPRFGGPRKRGR
jgi:hypothetical protein